jgi:hypothetical protein
VLVVRVQRGREDDDARRRGGGQLLDGGRGRGRVVGPVVGVVVGIAAAAAAAAVRAAAGERVGALGGEADGERLDAVQVEPEAADPVLQAAQRQARRVRAVGDEGADLERVVVADARAEGR